MPVTLPVGSLIEVANRSVYLLGPFRRVLRRVGLAWPSITLERTSRANRIAPAQDDRHCARQSLVLDAPGCDKQYFRRLVGTEVPRIGGGACGLGSRSRAPKKTLKILLIPNSRADKHFLAEGMKIIIDVATQL